jgi:hypothetical protein
MDVQRVNRFLSRSWYARRYGLKVPGSSPEFSLNLGSRGKEKNLFAVSDGNKEKKSE